MHALAGSEINGDDSYFLGADRIYQPVTPISHREDEYDSAGFHVLRDMQARHFWYCGRYRFIYWQLRKTMARLQSERCGNLRAIDIGGGCGGWLRYLTNRSPQLFSELALADSSLHALRLARDVLPAGVERYQVDLCDLRWSNRWDVLFLFDVLEHIPSDGLALRQIYEALRPGGLLFLTTPALKFFWSYNDDLAKHVRRYSRGDFRRLASDAGFADSYSRYFMFFLSPLLYLARWKSPAVDEMTQDQIREYLQATHRVPAAPVNVILKCIFNLETPLGHFLPFPWGTSILGVFRK